jgi:hypothetical protein
MESGRSDSWLERCGRLDSNREKPDARLLKRFYPARLESSPSSAIASAISGISGVGDADRPA